MAWSFAVPDWEERLLASRSLMPFLPLFPTQAERARSIFNRLRLPDVVGHPRNEGACGDWLRDFVVGILGSLDPVTRQRMAPEGFLMVPKKNNKTTGAAHAMLTALAENERPNAEFYLIGARQLIAEQSFSQAVGTLSADARLSDRFYVQEHKKCITYGPTGATLEIRSFDPKIVTGIRPSGVLLDEVHLLGSEAEADRVIGQLRGGMISQSEAFFAMITTQSERPPAGVFKSELARARDVRDGRRHDAMLAILYEFPDSIRLATADAEGNFPWENSALWPRVTPNLNRSIKIDALQQLYRKAKDDGRGELIRWASQHLNIEVGEQLRADGWAGAKYWSGCAEQGLTLDDVLQRSEVVVIGLDGGGLNDLFGLCVLGRERGDGELRHRRWLAWFHAWAYPEVLEQNKLEAPRFEDFRKAGELTLCESVGEDVDEIVDIIVKTYESGLLAEIGADAAGAAISDVIEAVYVAIYGQAEPPEGGELITSIPQGYQLQQASKGCERRLAAKSQNLKHPGQALMAYCVGNAKTEMRGNAMYVTKAVSGRGKIDPLMALFDAAFLMARNPEAKGSVYTESRGLIVIG